MKKVLCDSWMVQVYQCMSVTKLNSWDIIDSKFTFLQVVAFVSEREKDEGVGSSNCDK